MGGTYQQILMQNSKTFPKETSLQPPSNRGSEHRRGVTPHLPVSAIPPCAALVLNVTLVYLRPNQRFTSGFCTRRAAAGSPSAGRSAQRLPRTVGDGQLRLLRFGCCGSAAALLPQPALQGNQLLTDSLWNAFACVSSTPELMWNYLQFKTVPNLLYSLKMG